MLMDNTAFLGDPKQVVLVLQAWIVGSILLTNFHGIEVGVYKSKNASVMLCEKETV